MDSSILVGGALAAGIPLVLLLCRRFGSPPSNREKRAWLYFVALLIFTNSVIGIYGLATQAYYDLFPVVAGVAVGSTLVFVFYVYFYGWINDNN